MIEPAPSDFLTGARDDARATDARATDARATDARDDLLGFTPVPRQRIRHDGWTVERQRRFIAALADTGSVKSAARSINMTFAGVYRLRRHAQGDGFRAAWDAALAMGVQRLEDIAMERAIDGVEEVVWHQGRAVGVRRVYNDKLLMFLLRNRAAHRFNADSLNSHDATTQAQLERIKRQWRAEWEAEREREAERGAEAIHASIDAKLDRMRARMEAAEGLAGGEEVDAGERSEALRDPKESGTPGQARGDDRGRVDEGGRGESRERGDGAERGNEGGRGDDGDRDASIAPDSPSPAASPRLIMHLLSQGDKALGLPNPCRADAMARMVGKADLRSFTKPPTPAEQAIRDWQAHVEAGRMGGRGGGDRERE